MRYKVRINRINRPVNNMAASEPSWPPSHPKPSGSRLVQNRIVMNIYSLSEEGEKGLEGKVADKMWSEMDFFFF